MVAVPLIRRADEMHAIGLSAAAPGGYAEQVVVEESLMFTLPNGLSPKLAVLTEPLAVGRHAVRRAEVRRSDVAIVIGCGPVGLAVICMSGPGRRRSRGERFLGRPAAACRRLRRGHRGGPGWRVAVRGAGSPQFPAEPSGRLGLAIGTMEKLRPMPVPWQHVWRIGRSWAGSRSTR